MSELQELRKRLLKLYDDASSIGVDTLHNQGYLTGLRLAIDITVQMIETERSEIKEYYMKDELSKL